MCYFYQLSHLKIAIGQLVERWASDQKVTGLGFDSRTGYSSLCSCERHFLDITEAQQPTRCDSTAHHITTRVVSRAGLFGSRSASGLRLTKCRA